MMRVFRHAWLLLVALLVGAVYRFVLRRPEEGAQPRIQKINARARAERLSAELGTEAAVEQIRREQKRKIDALDAEQVAKADHLRADPVALSEWLASL